MFFCCFNSFSFKRVRFDVVRDMVERRLAQADQPPERRLGAYWTALTPANLN